MQSDVTFRPYSTNDKDSCLSLFDANCPEFFAPNERADYLKFLEARPSGYELCLRAAEIAGAFGVFGHTASRQRLSWILLDPRFQGLGAGRAIMERVLGRAVLERTEVIDIAASHRSAAFFEKFGAVTLKVIDNGWGAGMHRIDMELRPGPHGSL